MKIKVYKIDVKNDEKIAVDARYRSFKYFPIGLFRNSFLAASQFCRKF